MPSRIAAIAALLALALIAPAAAQAQQGSSGPSAAAPAAQQDSFTTTDHRATVAAESEFDKLNADRDGTVRVIVGLQARHTPEGVLSASSVRAQRAQIVSARRDLLAALGRAGVDVVHTYGSVPYVALKLTRGALNRLRASGKAASVQTDQLARPLLDGSGPVVEATESAAVGRAGAGRLVAILDTGVQKAHLFLRQSSGATKVASEACYSANADCPGGVTSSTAAGSGEPCTYHAGDCSHGTHVAGIAAGRGTTSSGAAREARLISINVFSDVNGRARSFESDQIKGLERVNTLSSTFNIASANMSLGGSKSTVNCNSDARKPIIDTLRSKGIATAIASGNDGFTDGVSFPACIGTAITVGGTTKSDGMYVNSNSSPLVELLAPGVSIVSSVPDSTVPRDTQSSKTGTSMATPHVAGAWAVLRGINSTASVPTVLSALQTTGKPITDPDNGVVKPRIRVLTAGTRLADTGLRLAFAVTGTGLDMASGGVGLATRAGGPASGFITISGIPAGATLVSTKLIWTTIGGPDPLVVFRGVVTGGTLAGASRNTCWPTVNQNGANRTYYRSLSPLGNGTYSISGVGNGVPGDDGQGASLVTIYRKASGAFGKVYQRIGASTTSSSANTANATVVTSGNGVDTRLPSVHVAVGDGQSSAEDPLTYGGAAITPANAFSGLQGPSWDNKRVLMGTGTTPAGTVARVIGLRSQGDCLVMSHAAVSYETTG
jgi:hypothetical protein